MKKTRKFLLIIISIILVTGCGKVPKLENGQDIILEFADGNITVDEFYQTLKDKYASSMIVDIIDTYLLNKKYKTTAEETKAINEQISSIKKAITSQYNNEVTFEQYIEYYYGISTEAKFKEYLSLNYKRNLAIEDYVKDNITDDEINKYYEQKTVGDIKASHILITPDVTDTMTDDEKTKAQNDALVQAKEIVSRLNNGEKFATLAKELSDDKGSAENGGDLGYFNTGTMVEEFEDAVIKLEVGKYSAEPVKSSFGYHIILKVDQKEKPALAKVKDSIIQSLSEDKLSDDDALKVTAMIKFREKNGLVIHDDNLKSLYESLMDNTLINARNKTSN